MRTYNRIFDNCSGSDITGRDNDRVYNLRLIGYQLLIFNEFQVAAIGLYRYIFISAVQPFCYLTCHQLGAFFLKTLQ